MAFIFAFLILHWYLSLFCQTFYLHRYSAHKQFFMSKFWEGFFYVMTYVTQGSSYLSPRAYAILHRMHHAYSDTELDPHTPHFFPNAFAMMWRTKEIYSAILKHEAIPDAKFVGDYPDWTRFERFADSKASRLFWGIAYTAVYVFMAPYWWMFLFLPIHFLMGPIQGAVVNWCGHKYGYSSFDNKDKSKNTLIFDFLMMGELFQNNHHKFPMRANFAAKWYEFDPIFPIVWTLNKLRIIRLRKVALAPAIG